MDLENTIVVFDEHDLPKIVEVDPLVKKLNTEHLRKIIELRRENRRLAAAIERVRKECDDFINNEGWHSAARNSAITIRDSIGSVGEQ